MKKKCFFVALCLLCTLTSLAQSEGDEIIGKWKIDFDGKSSKVEIYKVEGGYRVRNYWMSNAYDDSGNLLYDTKNPDVKRRHIPWNKAVLVDRVVYNAKDKVWDDGRIYDPRSGRSFRMDIRVKDNNTLEIHGKWGPFYKKIYWKRVN